MQYPPACTSNKGVAASTTNIPPSRYFNQPIAMRKFMYSVVTSEYNLTLKLVRPSGRGGFNLAFKDGNQMFPNNTNSPKILPVYLGK